MATAEKMSRYLADGDRDFDPAGVDVYEFTDWDMLSAKIDGFLE